MIAMAFETRNARVASRHEEERNSHRERREEDEEEDADGAQPVASRESAPARRLRQRRETLADGIELGRLHHRCDQRRQRVAEDLLCLRSVARPAQREKRLQATALLRQRRHQIEDRRR